MNVVGHTLFGFASNSQSQSFSNIVHDETYPPACTQRGTGTARGGVVGCKKSMLKRAFPSSDADAYKSPTKKPCPETLDRLVQVSGTMSNTAHSCGAYDDYQTRVPTPNFTGEVSSQPTKMDALQISSNALCGFCLGPIHIRPDAFLRDHLASDQRMCTLCSWAIQRTAVISNRRGIIQDPTEQRRLEQIASRQYQAHMDEIDFFKRHNKTKPTIDASCYGTDHLHKYPVFSPALNPIELPPTPVLTPTTLSLLVQCDVQNAPALELPPSSSPYPPLPLRRQKSTISRMAATPTHGPSHGLFV